MIAIPIAKTCTFMDTWKVIADLRKEVMNLVAQEDSRASVYSISFSIHAALKMYLVLVVGSRIFPLVLLPSPVLFIRNTMNCI